MQYFCDLNEVEDENIFLLQCKSYKELWKKLVYYLLSTENINLTKGNRFEKLKPILAIRSWGTLNALAKFVREAYKN